MLILKAVVITDFSRYRGITRSVVRANARTGVRVEESKTVRKVLSQKRAQNDSKIIPLPVYWFVGKQIFAETNKATKLGTLVPWKQGATTPLKSALSDLPVYSPPVFPYPQVPGYPYLNGRLAGWV
jgi:hypothetical protein